MILDDVKQHYTSALGEPSRRASFQIDAYSAEVYKWSADQNPQGVALYASIGASRDPLTGMDSSHRVEFFIGFLPEQDSVARPLAMVALDPVLHGSTLGHGETVTYPEPLWPGTEMCSFLILRPQTHVIPDLMLPGGLHVEFMQLVPLFPSELEFKIAHDEDELMEELERAGVPFWEPDREPLTAAR